MARTALGVALFVTAVSAMIRVTVGAGVAHAGDAEEPWPSAATCATGAITGWEVLESEGYGPYLELSGWIEPCVDDKGAGAPADALFGFAYFGGFTAGMGPVGVVHTGRLRSYAGSAGPTQIRGTYDTWGSGRYLAERPLCLLRDRDTRLACVNVREYTYTDPKIGTVTTFEVTPIPLTDVRVDKHHTVFADGSSTNPECAACV